MTDAGDAQTRVIRNAALLLLRQLVVTGLGIVAMALIARHLGPGGLGRFEYTFALVGACTALASFGLRGVTVRTIARGDRPLASYLGLMASLRLLLSFAVWPVLMAVAYGNDNRNALLVLVAVASVTLPVNALGTTLRDGFIGLERFDVEAAAGVFTRLVTFAGVVAVVVADGGVLAMVAVYTTGAAAGLLVPLAAMRRDRSPLRLRWSTREAVRELRYAVPFGANAAVALLMWEANPLLLEALSGLTMVGIFAAGSRLLVPLAMIPDAISDALTPAVTRVWVGEDGAARCGTLVSRAFYGLLALALPAAAGALVCADGLIALVFGDGFGQAASVFRVIGAVLPFEFLAVAAADVLAAIYQQNGRLWISCLGAAVNVALLFTLVPGFGAVGCAWAVAATTAVCCLAYLWLVARHCPLSIDAGAYGKLLATVAVMTVAMLLALPLGVLVAAAAGVAVYGGAVWSGAISIDAVRRALRGRVPATADPDEQMP